MINIVQERDNIYTVSFDVPELHLLTQIASGFKMPIREALRTCISRGLDSTVSVLQEIAAYEKRNREQLESEG